MKKLFLGLVLFLVSLQLINAQTRVKLKHKEYVVLIYRNGKFLDSLPRMQENLAQLKVINNRLFQVAGMVIAHECAFSYQIREYNTTGDSLQLINMIYFNTRQCVSCKELTSSFKIRLRNKNITWQLKRNGKKMVGKIGYDEFSTMDKFEFPKSMCGLPKEYWPD